MLRQLRPALVLCLMFGNAIGTAQETEKEKTDKIKLGDTNPAEVKPADVKPARPLNGERGLTVEQLAKRAKVSVVVITATGRDGKQQGLGTGFVVSKDGLIATNQHVIGEARPISVQLANGKRLEVVEIHAVDRALDLAVLRVKATDLTPLVLGDSSQVQDGEPVVAMGNPHGLKHSVVSGVVSGKREIENRPMIQLAMPIEPGNSGGPVLDDRGNVVGVVTMKSNVTNNLGFAVEINQLKPLLEKPSPIPMARWLTIGAIDPKVWTPLFGARWQQRAGRIVVAGAGEGFGGRSLCLSQAVVPAVPFELAVQVRLNDEAGAAGLVFHADGQDKHYGFYPSAGKLRLSCFEGPTVYQWRVLHDVPSIHYRPGDWNHLKVKVEAGRLTCYVNDQPVIESTDVTYKEGKVGLAKFRDTEAEFKGFQIGQNLTANQIDPQTITKLRQVIDVLPPIATMQGEQLRGIVEAGAAGPVSLRDRAKELEKRASELRRIATDVHVRQVLERLRKIVGNDEPDFDLLRATLLIAKLDDEEVDVESYVRDVERMASEIKQSLPNDADEKSRVAALNRYLFKENGFHGSRFEYYHRANSYLNRVIDDREGIPITLSILYMELGQRLDLRILGVGLPGHFVVKHVDKAGDEQLIDVFEGGVAMSRDDAKKKVSENSDQEFRDEMLHHADDRQILQRVLRNLLNNAQRADDKEAMLRYTETLLAVVPAALQERGLRAVLRFETGRRGEAIADLDWFLENKPEGIDLERIREMRSFFETGKR